MFEVDAVPRSYFAGLVWYDIKCRAITRNERTIGPLILYIVSFV
jgi:hypothetical protein